MVEPLLPVSDAAEFEPGDFSFEVSCRIAGDLFSHGAAGLDVTVRLYQEPLHYPTSYPTKHFALNKGALLGTIYFRENGDPHLLTYPVSDVEMTFPEANRDFYGFNFSTNTDDITLGNPWYFLADCNFGVNLPAPFMTYTEWLPRWRIGWENFGAPLLEPFRWTIINGERGTTLGRVADPKRAFEPVRGW